MRRFGTSGRARPKPIGPRRQGAQLAAVVTVTAAAALTPPSGGGPISFAASVTCTALAYFSTGTLTAHPRIWWDSTMAALVSAKVAANDADWLSIKGRADTAKTLTIPRLTITAASNTNPVQFTVTETVPWTGTDGWLFIVGGAGNWAGVNSTLGPAPALSPNAWSATKTGAHTFTIPVNAFSFGSFSGQTLCAFWATATDAGFYEFGLQGDSWERNTRALLIADKVLGGSDSSYRTKALQLLDYMNELGAAGMIAPVTIDSGRASMHSTFILAMIYDWLYSSLSSAQKSASVVTVNLWNDWTSNYTFSVNDARSNYWQAANTAVLSSAYATFDENPRGGEWVLWGNSNWQHFDNMFGNPAGTNVNDEAGAFYTGGVNFLGFNYGANDMGRHCKFLHMYKTANGIDKAGAIANVKTWATAMLYELRPDRIHTFTHGQWTGAFYGLFQDQGALSMAHLLTGSVESRWMQWMAQHLGTIPTFGDAFVHSMPTDERVLFYDASRAQTDYKLTESLTYFGAGKSATLFYRSDWTDNAIYSYFTCTTSQSDGSTPKVAAHIDISRGADNLLVQSNYFKGTGTGESGSPENQAFASAYTNSLYFWDYAIRCFDQSATYDGCSLGFGIYVAPTVRTSSTWAWARNDFAPAYDYFNNPAARTLPYAFRDYLAAGDGVFVVVDRVKSTDSSHSKHLRWNFPGPDVCTPVIDAANGLITATVSGSSVLFAKTLLPTEASLRLVRNQTVGGQNMNWRVEVANPTPGLMANFVTVFVAAAAGASVPNIVTLDADSNFVAVQVPGTTAKVAVLPIQVQDNGGYSFSSPLQTSCTFVSTHSGTGEYFVQGLAAGTYTVRRGATAIVTVTIAADDVIRFLGTSGVYSVR